MADVGVKAVDVATAQDAGVGAGDADLNRVAQRGASRRREHARGACAAARRLGVRRTGERDNERDARKRGRGRYTHHRWRWFSKTAEAARDPWATMIWGRGNENEKNCAGNLLHCNT